MTQVEIPTLETDLREGCSDRCLAVIVGHYGLDKEMIKVSEEARERALELMDSDVNFAGRIDETLEEFERSLKNLDDHSKKIRYRHILTTLMEIQKTALSSELSDQQKEDFWKPIAEYYIQVRTTLSQVINPFEKENIKMEGLVKVGDTIVATAYYIRSESGVINAMEIGLDGFCYSVMLATGTGSFKETINLVEFEEGHLRTLPPELASQLIARRKCQIPLKIVSATYEKVVVEIDIEAWDTMREEETPDSD